MEGVGASSVAFRSNALNRGTEQNHSERIKLVDSEAVANDFIESMKVAQTFSERVAAFQLVQQMYFRAGLTNDTKVDMRVTKHHLLDTTDVLISKPDRRVDFTVTLVRDGIEGLPAESLFNEEIVAMRNEGLRLAEVSCVASAVPENDRRKCMEKLVAMIGLAIHTARRRKVDRLLLAVHPRHAKVYRRMFGCVACSDVRDYAAVEGNPAVLCMHDFKRLDETGYSLYEKIYGTQYRPWQFDGTKMTAPERAYFREQVSAEADSFVPMAA
ncbi:N-acyl amino acid synthase FeeM domain-containing protein [Roseiconus lacunae]|uniref:N-acyl amino acid synthase FeeM catalytic core domain-containing protein n=1 Tax=Roseiconus lacunae TaxID=2605694 RepID=A0ABT7PPA9_9BACT|nr:hypothetical protein [Roseiconus lacunae]MDM4018342.1 hypothetical protein [Roseiconus lacunae]